ISDRSRNARSAAYRRSSVLADGSPASSPATTRSPKMPEASHWLTPPRLVRGSAAAAARAAARTASWFSPSTPTRGAEAADFARAPLLATAGPVERQPLRHGVHVPLGPRPRRASGEQLAQHVVLRAHRLLAVHGDHVEDERQRVVLANHARDEPVVA